MTYIDPAAKLFQHLDVIHAIKEGERPAPINVEIDLSNRCSLGCEWCHFAYTHTRGPAKGKMAKPTGAIAGGDLMRVDLAASIIDQLKAAGVQSITWTGGGEPTLHPDFDSIINYAWIQNMMQGIYTHGGHVTKQRAVQMKDEMTFVYVSLDAATRASYARAKGVDRFHAACDGIRALADADGPATIGIGYLLTAENWQQIPHMIRLKDELGADYCQFRPTILFDDQSPGVRTEDTDWMTDAVALLEEYEGTDGVEMDLNRMRRYQDWTGHGYETCYHSATHTVITPNGKVWTCVNKREYPDAELGDLSTETFDSIWQRHEPCKVNASCRVMCRGHSENLVWQELLKPVKHEAFV